MKFFDKLSLRATGALAAASLASLLASTSAYAEDKVTAVHAFPGFLVYNQNLFPSLIPFHLIANLFFLKDCAH